MTALASYTPDGRAFPYYMLLDTRRMGDTELEGYPYYGWMYVPPRVAAEMGCSSGEAVQQAPRCSPKVKVGSAVVFALVIFTTGSGVPTGRFMKRTTNVKEMTFVGTNAIALGYYNPVGRVPKEYGFRSLVPYSSRINAANEDKGTSPSWRSYVETGEGNAPVVKELPLPDGTFPKYFFYGPSVENKKISCQSFGEDGNALGQDILPSMLEVIHNGAQVLGERECACPLRDVLKYEGSSCVLRGPPDRGPSASRSPSYEYLVGGSYDPFPVKVSESPPWYTFMDCFSYLRGDPSTHVYSEMVGSNGVLRGRSMYRSKDYGYCYLPSRNTATDRPKAVVEGDTIRLTVRVTCSIDEYGRGSMSRGEVKYIQREYNIKSNSRLFDSVKSLDFDQSADGDARFESWIEDKHAEVKDEASMQIRDEKDASACKVERVLFQCNPHTADEDLVSDPRLCNDKRQNQTAMIVFVVVILVFAGAVFLAVQMQG